MQPSVEKVEFRPRCLTPMDTGTIYVFADDGPDLDVTVIVV